MIHDIATRELPEWINLGALTTPDEISQRETLVARGAELLPALATWISDAMPLAQLPPLLEVVDDTRELMYSRMGISPLAEAIDQLRELLARWEASSPEAGNTVSQLPAGDSFDVETDEIDRRHNGDPVAATSDAERTGRWRNQK